MSEKTHYPYQLTPLQFQSLDRACTQILQGFGDTALGCYLVGSAGRSVMGRVNYRDVDVRLIMTNADYDVMFGPEGNRNNQYWSLLCMLISSWLAQQTGLPVDFQIQRQNDANEGHPGPRNGLGVDHDFSMYPGEFPSSVDEWRKCLADFQCRTCKQRFSTARGEPRKRCPACQADRPEFLGITQIETGP
jgi:hypothetical protein